MSSLSRRFLRVEDRIVTGQIRRYQEWLDRTSLEEWETFCRRVDGQLLEAGFRPMEEISSDYQNSLEGSRKAELFSIVFRAYGETRRQDIQPEESA